MPRRRQPARLYLRARGGREPVWVIRDGSREISTGRPEREREAAQEALGRYLGEQWTPPAGDCHPNRLLITEVLATYAREHAPTTERPDIIGYAISHIAGWCKDRTVATIRAGTCRDYADSRTAAGVAAVTARRELEVLRAALNYFAREHGMDGQSPPQVTLPPRGNRRERWLTRSEVAALVACARRSPDTAHVARYLLIGVYSGTRPRAILGLSWLPSPNGGWIDVDGGVIHRRPPGSRDTSKKRRPPVRIHDRLLPHLARWRAADLAAGVAWAIHYHGRPVTKLRRSWASVRGRAGLGSDVVPYTTRHTAATWLMQAGVDLYEAAGYLGMSARILEEVYAHHHPDWQRRAASATTRHLVSGAKAGRSFEAR